MAIRRVRSRIGKHDIISDGYLAATLRDQGWQYRPDTGDAKDPASPITMHEVYVTLEDGRDDTIWVIRNGDTEATITTDSVPTPKQAHLMLNKVRAGLTRAGHFGWSTETWGPVYEDASGIERQVQTDIGRCVSCGEVGPLATHGKLGRRANGNVESVGICSTCLAAHRAAERFFGDPPAND